MKSFSLEIPLPTKLLSPNYRGHTRGSRALEVAAYREMCRVAYVQAGLPVFTVKLGRGHRASRVRIDLDYYLAPKRNRLGEKLPDNYYRPKDEDSGRGAFKAGQDALADAGLVPNDSATYVECGSTRLRASQAEHGGERKLVVTFTVADLPKPDAVAEARGLVALTKPAISPALQKLRMNAYKKAKQGQRRSRG